MRQVSPESEPIFDFILALHKSSNGDWKALGQKAGVAEDDITSFLQYAAQFLGVSTYLFVLSTEPSIRSAVLTHTRTEATIKASETPNSFLAARRVMLRSWLRPPPKPKSSTKPPREEYSPPATLP